MQIIEFTEGSLRFLETVPEQLGAGRFVWIYLDRDDFAAHLPQLQIAAQRLGGSPLLDVHLSDLQNAQHPSHYDYTSIYDLVIFRRLATPMEMLSEAKQEAAVTAYHSQGVPQRPGKKQTPIIRRIHSKAVGFAVFDRLLISTHTRGCYAARNFVQRYLLDAKHSVELTSARSRLPSSPADLSLRMINVMVDSYLELRKELSSELDHWQAELLKPSSRFNNWGALMSARGQLHVLEDLCDEQHDAMQEWLDAIQETPQTTLSLDTAEQRAAFQLQRDQLIARARDVMEHIERVMRHAQRLEQSAETVVQIHFSAQSNRTNDIMRTLTALTAIFLPLNLIAGIFGMNFEFLPFIHDKAGFWWALSSMVLTAAVLGLVFWRKRYLARTRG
ncbi:MAG: magnesium transporter CorA family protein [Brachymonas sp.]|nr:magnesium transporter CorA family protein [Brachymonas sp.]